MLSEMTGNIQPGADLRFTVTDAEGERRSMGGRLFEVTPGSRLEWRGGSVFTFIGHHYFELAGLGEETKVTHGETFYGLAPLLLRHVLDRKAAPLYASLNRSLKTRVETLLQERSS